MSSIQGSRRTLNYSSGFELKRVRELLEGLAKRLIKSASFWVSSFIRAAYVALDPRPRVNMGSGRHSWRGWISLDGVSFPGVTKFHFEENSRVPIDDSYSGLVYTSHFLEHVPDSVVDSVLREAHRIISDDGLLVVKIPDFESFLAAFENSDFSYFAEIGVADVSKTWHNHGIQDGVSARFAMMFCGYLTSDLGSWFDPSLDHASSSTFFHGPPNLGREELIEIVASSTGPHEIAVRLRELALKEGATNFNHQNAWGKDEMEALLFSHGFEVLDETRALSRFARREIPDFTEMANFSKVYFARKVLRPINDVSGIPRIVSERGLS